MEQLFQMSSQNLHHAYIATQKKVKEQTINTKIYLVQEQGTL